MSRKQTRFTVTFDADLVDVLDTLASSQHTSKAGVLRRAIALLDYLDGQSRIPGQKVMILDADSNPIREIVFM